MSTPHFHRLRIKRVESLTQDAVQISFAVAPPLLRDFAFQPGQFLTLRAEIGGESVRRKPPEVSEERCVGPHNSCVFAESAWLQSRRIVVR